jgi:biopolymer transport protein ExbD
MLNRLHREDEDNIISQINIIPLVDISLVLLIIFIVTANHIIMPSIKVDIPRASSAQNMDNSRDMNITVSGEGVLYIDDKIVTIKELKTEVSRRYQKDSSLGVVLNIDKSTYFQRVVDALDVFSELGISKINIRTIKQ